MSNHNINDNTLKIDFGNNMSTGLENYGVDTITLTGASDTIDLTGAPVSIYNYSNTWSSTNYNTGSILTGSNGINTILDVTDKVKLDDNGINLTNDADIKIGHRSLRTFMEKMEQRLAILQPDPELLEKYEALRQAYEHYQTLEALCIGNPPKNPNSG